jgi:hypothetical protein
VIFKPCHALRASIGIGAAYDLVAGVSIAVALEPLSRLLPIPYPLEPFYARLCGVLLAGLGVLYSLAYFDIEQHLRIVAAAVLVRTAGGLFLAGYVLWPGAPWFFLVFGGIDLAFAAWHLVLLHTEARTPFWPLLFRGRLGGDSLP